MIVVGGGLFLIREVPLCSGLFRKRENGQVAGPLHTPRRGRRAPGGILKLTSWVPGTNMSTLARNRALAGARISKQ